ncbi:MAG TPA: hypothetical protein V6D14_23700 [Coleofasciculaceae cyanobacterium]
MSDCALFPASPSRNRVWSVWADRESHLSLVGRACTCIRPRVQPFGWRDYLRVVYRDSSRNESHESLHCANITTLTSLEYSLLEAVDMTVEFLPGHIFPIHHEFSLSDHCFE